jgi:cytoplasmic iron level regulating protein YaaA (DUF328/UPF0246 family)
MLVLLPPSETKAPGGDGGPLELDELSFPECYPVREKLAGALVELAADVPASLVALGLSARQEFEVRRNAALWESPTLPALARYTGVLFDALDAASLAGAEFARASERLCVASALFGLLRGGDPIPAYRLSAGSRLPGLPTSRSLWRPMVSPLLEASRELVVDLRSGAYASMAPAAGAVPVRVVSESASGRRTAVAHHNKAYKGRLARLLGTCDPEPRTAGELVEVAGAGGICLEPREAGGLDLLVD